MKIKKLLPVTLLSLSLVSCTRFDQHYLPFVNVCNTREHVCFKIKSGVSSRYNGVYSRFTTAKKNLSSNVLYNELKECNPDNKISLGADGDYIYISDSGNLYCVIQKNLKNDKYTFYELVQSVKQLHTGDPNGSLFYLTVPYHLFKDPYLTDFLDTYLLLDHGYFYSYDMAALKAFYEEWTPYRIIDISSSKILLSQGENKIYVSLSKSGAFQEICFSLE